MRNCIKLCYVPQSCPLTESDINGSSGNKRKFFLCRNLSFCLKYQSAQSLKVFRFFQEMKEYNLDQVKPEHDLSLAKVSDLLASKETERTNKVQSATVLPQLIKRQASSENHVASNKLLLSFMKKRKIQTQLQMLTCLILNNLAPSVKAMKTTVVRRRMF